MKKKKAQLEKENKEKTVLNGTVSLKDMIAPEMIDRRSADHLLIGNKYVRNYLLSGYPKQIGVGWANNLYDYAGDLDIALHVIPVDERAALDELTNKITQFQAQLATEIDKGSNRNITRLQTQINELIEERSKAEQNYISIFEIQMIMNLYSSSLEQLNKKSQLLESSMRGRKVKLSNSYLRQDQGYKSALPYGKSWLPSNFRNFSSEALTACFPFYNSEISHSGGVMIGVNTQTRTPIYIDFFNRKLLDSGNTTVFGMTGSGKTFFTSLVIMRSALNGVVTAIVDPENDYGDITKALGGTVIKIGPGGQIPNPFDISEEDILDSEGRPTGIMEIRLKDKIIDILNLIGTMCAGKLTNEQKALITAVAARVYEKFGITEDPKSLYSEGNHINSKGELFYSGIKKTMPRFSDFHSELTEFSKLSGNESLAEIVNTLAMFKEDGVFGLFDCTTPKELENLDDSPVISFDISSLNDDTLRPIGMYIALSWCMSRFVSRNIHVRKRVICDEAWMMVKKSMAGSDYTSFFLENLARRIRKRNGALYISSQNFKEFAESAQGEAILFNTHTHIFFKQNSTDIDAVQEKFKLSDGEKEFLSSISKGYFLLKMGKESTTGFAKAFDYERRLIETRRMSGI